MALDDGNHGQEATVGYQLAYRIGPMSSALPAIILVNPLLSVVYGVTVQPIP